MIGVAVGAAEHPAATTEKTTIKVRVIFVLTLLTEPSA